MWPIHILVTLIKFTERNTGYIINVIRYSNWLINRWTSGAFYTCNWLLSQTFIESKFAYHLFMATMVMWSMKVDNSVDYFSSHTISITIRIMDHVSKSTYCSVTVSIWYHLSPSFLSVSNVGWTSYFTRRCVNGTEKLNKRSLSGTCQYWMHVCDRFIRTLRLNAVIIENMNTSSLQVMFIMIRNSEKWLKHDPWRGWMYRIVFRIF